MISRTVLKQRSGACVKLGLLFEILAVEKYLVALVFRCTSLYGTPTTFIDVLNHPALDKFDVSRLYTG